MRRLKWGIVTSAALLAGGFGTGSARAQYVGHLSTLVMNVKSGRVVLAEDADLPRYPASLTKLMTLYMAFDALRQGALKLTDRIPVSLHAATQEPSRLGLRPGSHLTVKQAIFALVTKSANDAACALGEYLGSGSESRFSEQMTLQARVLGMSRTTFRNASGLPDAEQVTTARDLARLARRIVTEFPEYYEYFSVENFRFRRRNIPNHNPMLHLYAGADGMKTGYTEEAGHNLISSAERNGVRLVGVVLGAPTNRVRNQTMISLLDSGFDDAGLPRLPLLVQPRRGPTLWQVHHRARSSRARVILVSYRPKKSRRVRPVRKMLRSAAAHRGRHRS